MPEDGYTDGKRSRERWQLRWAVIFVSFEPQVVSNGVPVTRADSWEGFDGGRCRQCLVQIPRRRGHDGGDADYMPLARPVNWSPINSGSLKLPSRGRCPGASGTTKGPASEKSAHKGQPVLSKCYSLDGQATSLETAQSWPEGKRGETRQGAAAI